MPFVGSENTKEPDCSQMLLVTSMLYMPLALLFLEEQYAVNLTYALFTLNVTPAPVKDAPGAIKEGVSVALSAVLAAPSAIVPSILKVQP